MAAPIVTIELAQRLYAQGKPFCVTLRFRGPSGNKRGFSDKWWQLTYDGTHNGVVLCNHGAAGTAGRKKPFEYPMTRAVAKCQVKLSAAKGYKYTTNTLTRMPRQRVTQPKVVLVGVFTEIRTIEQFADDHFKAFDSNGDYLLDLTEEGTEQVSGADPHRVSVEWL